MGEKIESNRLSLGEKFLPLGYFGMSPGQVVINAMRQHHKGEMSNEELNGLLMNIYALINKPPLQGSESDR